MKRFATALALVLASCGVHHTGLLPAAQAHLADAPLVAIVLDSGAALEWQEERDEALVAKLEECLPAALAPICPGSCTVVEGVAQDGDLGPYVVLDVTTSYSASAHFMYGFVLKVSFVMLDRSRTTQLARFAYVHEPSTKVMADGNAPLDEVLTFDPAQAAARFCQDVKAMAEDMSKKKDG